MAKRAAAIFALITFLFLLGPAAAREWKSDLGHEENFPEAVYKNFLSLPQTTVGEVIASFPVGGLKNKFWPSKFLITVDIRNDTAVFYLRGPEAQGLWPIEKKYIIEIRWRKDNEWRVWARILLRQGESIIYLGLGDGFLFQNPIFQPQAENAPF